jgi:hypothetical protein
VSAHAKGQCFNGKPFLKKTEFLSKFWLPPWLINRSHLTISDQIYDSSCQYMIHESYDSMKIQRTWCNEGTQERHTYKPTSSIQQKIFMYKNDACHCSCSSCSTYCWLVICWISSSSAVRNTFKHLRRRHCSHHVEIWHLVGKYYIHTHKKKILSVHFHPCYIRLQLMSKAQPLMPYIFSHCTLWSLPSMPETESQLQYIIKVIWEACTFLIYWNEKEPRHCSA